MEEQKRQWDEWFAERQAVSDSIDAEVAAILEGEDPFTSDRPTVRQFRDRPIAADFLAIAERYRANS
jgi:hypothetical protein